VHIRRWFKLFLELHKLWFRTAQIYLELHFCVELHTKKPCKVLDKA